MLEVYQLKESFMIGCVAQKSCRSLVVVSWWHHGTLLVVVGMIGASQFFYRYVLSTGRSWFAQAHSFSGCEVWYLVTLNSSTNPSLSPDPRREANPRLHWVCSQIGLIHMVKCGYNVIGFLITFLLETFQSVNGVAMAEQDQPWLLPTTAYPATVMIFTVLPGNKSTRTSGHDLRDNANKPGKPPNGVTKKKVQRKRSEHGNK